MKRYPFLDRPRGASLTTLWEPITIDGAPAGNLLAFFEANPDLPEDDVDRLLSLRPGESVTIGGGAAASFVVALAARPVTP